MLIQPQKTRSVVVTISNVTTTTVILIATIQIIVTIETVTSTILIRWGYKETFHRGNNIVFFVFVTIDHKLFAPGQSRIKSILWVCQDPGIPKVFETKRSIQRERCHRLSLPLPTHNGPNLTDLRFSYSFN